MEKSVSTRQPSRVSHDFADREAASGVGGRMQIFNGLVSYEVLDDIACDALQPRLYAGMTSEPFQPLGALQKEFWVRSSATFCWILNRLTAVGVFGRDGGGFNSRRQRQIPGFRQ